MDIAAVFGPFQNRHGFLIGNITALTGFTAIVSEVTHTDTPLGLNIAGAFVTNTLLLTAGADCHTDVTFVLFQPVGQMLNIQ